VVHILGEQQDEHGGSTAAAELQAARTSVLESQATSRGGGRPPHGARAWQQQRPPTALLG
jgi:hypothetical protein